MVKKKVIIGSIATFLLLIVGGVIGTYFYISGTIYKPTTTSKVFVSKEQQQKVDYQEESGVYNILLCGLDGRKKDTDARTDSMIVATIDTKNKAVKMVSFMRDLYVPIPGHGQTRLNTAYFLGGPELLMKTLNEDFNYNIQYYATIDFHAFQAMVEVIGGVDVDVKDYEMSQLNYYIKEANWHNPQFLTHAGFQHLNGQQALSYCRIRKAGNNDYERTERQRKVLSLIITKVKKMSIFKYPSLLTAIMPDIKTNIPTPKLANLGFTVMKFGSVNVQSARIPADNLYQNVKVGGADVLVADMDKTLAYLDNFLSSTGSSGVSNLPAYMANNYHAGDIPVDKRSARYSSVKVSVTEGEKESGSKRTSSKKHRVRDRSKKTQETDSSIGSKNSESNTNKEVNTGTTGENNSQDGNASDASSQNQQGSDQIPAPSSQDDGGNTGN